MKDTLKNRMKAIEARVAMDEGFDIECTLAMKRHEKMTALQLQQLLETANDIITDVYHLSHGYNSKCCKGRGAAKIEQLIKSYF